MKSQYTEKLKIVTGTLPWNRQKNQTEHDFMLDIQPGRLYMFVSDSRTQKCFGTLYAFLCTRESLDVGATLLWLDCEQTPVRQNTSTTLMKYLFRRNDAEDIEFRQRKEVIAKEELHTIPSMLGIRKIEFVFELDSMVKSPASLITHVENVLARNIICEIADDGTTRLDIERWARSITIAHPIYACAKRSEPKKQRFEVCSDIVKSLPRRSRKNETTWMTAEEIDAYPSGNAKAERDDISSLKTQKSSG